MTKLQAVFAATLIQDILSDRTDADATMHEEVRRRYGTTGEEALRNAARSLAAEFQFDLET